MLIESTTSRRLVGESFCTGTVDQGVVATLVEQTRLQFMSRVDEMFRPH